MVRRHGVRGLRGQALAFHRRERLLGHKTVVSDLFRTASFEPGDTIPTATHFPYRTGDVAFEFELTVTGPAPAGDPLQIGSGPNVTLSIVGTDLTLHVGGAGNDGVDLTAPDALPAEGKYRIAIAARAGTGEARLWVNGRLLARGQSVDEDFSEWSNDADGAYGVGLTDAEVTSVLGVYMKQVPQHFDESLYA
ncbi:MAG TPA: hypothetical protein VFW95_05945 [Candidatus Limnocylindria bacterium]|nr:hypothetical protein [Candidatus Limnocylindria bacterium]